MVVAETKHLTFFYFQDDRGRRQSSYARMGQTKR